MPGGATRALAATVVTSAQRSPPRPTDTHIRCVWSASHRRSGLWGVVWFRSGPALRERYRRPRAARRAVPARERVLPGVFAYAADVALVPLVEGRTQLPQLRGQVAVAPRARWRSRPDRSARPGRSPPGPGSGRGPRAGRCGPGRDRGRGHHQRRPPTAECLIPDVPGAPDARSGAGAWRRTRCPRWGSEPGPPVTESHSATSVQVNTAEQ